MRQSGNTTCQPVFSEEPSKKRCTFSGNFASRSLSIYATQGRRHFLAHRCKYRGGYYKYKQEGEDHRKKQKKRRENEQVSEETRVPLGLESIR